MEPFHEVKCRTPLKIRPATLADLDEIVRIQASGYAPEMCESRECLAAILGLKRSLVACVALEDARLVAYLLIHTYEYDNVPRLGCLEDVRWRNRYRVWIHDLCVDSEWRGGGIGREMVDDLLVRYRISDVRLVSMNAFTHEFWMKRGFLAIEKYVGRGYGEKAWLMERIDS